MRIDRRTFVVSSFCLLLPQAVLARPQGRATPWIELAKILGDVGDSLYRFSDSIDKITRQTVKTVDWFRGRQARPVLMGMSRRLTRLLADQQEVQTSLDRYGDLWRRAHRRKHKPTPEERAALNAQWKIAVGTIKVIGQQTTALLDEVRNEDSDIILDDAYVDLQKALRGKVGVLDRIAREPAPRNPQELSDLVESEETFLHLQANARNALSSVNDAIRRLSD